MRKETAVEWLIGELNGYDEDCEIFQIAKAMEREQMEINLPSDEEIETFALSVSPEPQKNQSTWIAYKATIAGAEWVVNKIKGGEQ